MRLRDMPDDDTLLATYAERDEERPAIYLIGGMETSRGSALGAIKIGLALDRQPALVLSTDLMLNLIARLEDVEDAVGR